MKSLRAVGVIGAAGLGSIAHAVAICDCSVIDCCTDVVANEQLCANGLLDDTVLDELAHGVSDIYTVMDLAFNGSSGSAIIQDLFYLEFSEELERGVEFGFDFYFVIAMRGAQKTYQMDVAFDSMADRNSLQAYLEPEYVGRASMGRGIDFQIYTVANMIAWTLAMLSTRVRLPT